MKELETVLTQMFEDFRLSSGEKHALKEVLVPYANDDEALSFVRNRAFELAGAQVRESSQHHLESVKWLAQVVKVLGGMSHSEAKIESNVYFSPGTDCVEQVIQHIRGAKTRIDVCVFTISDDQISDALVAAHQNGVDVRIITDDEKTEDAGSDIFRMKKAGLPIKLDNNPSHMHHKFAVFDNRTVISGSFNWTRSASMYNHEDITVSNHPAAVQQFGDRFNTLWRRFSDL
ncbi:MAG: nuclease [Deltaproteobacteria bacterium]|nr:nuclease [Deltaproteobacteria bacterium]MBN2672804.1 nuclease [Deltaproteobacteria bacterium]